MAGNRDRTLVERLLLEYAVDDDVVPCQIIWRLDYRFPDEPPAARREMAETCLRSLVSRGLVVLLRGITFHGDETTVSVAEVDAALADEEWEPSVGREHTRVRATVAGRSYYQNLGRVERPADDEEI